MLTRKDSLVNLLMVFAMISRECIGREKIILETVQGTVSVGGLACALSDLLNSSGFEFDIQNATCTKLAKYWFSNLTVKQNMDYFKIVQLEYIVEKTDRKDYLVPSVLTPGGSVILYVETSSRPFVGTASIDFSPTTSQFATDISLHNIFYPGWYVLNTKKNGIWGTEELLPSPLNQLAASFEFEFRFTDSHVKNKWVKLLMVFAMISRMCFERQKVIFQTVQGTVSLDGLACALGDLLNSIGFEFDSQNATCTKLPKGWFSNSTAKPNMDYFKIVQLEYVVEQTDRKDYLIPPVLIPGGSVILHVDTSSSPFAGVASMNFYPTTTQFATDISLHNVLYPGWYVLNSRTNGHWGTEVLMTNPFVQLAASYELEFRFTDSEVEIYIDDQLFYSYAHRMSVSMYQRLEILDNDYLFCKRLLFRY